MREKQDENSLLRQRLQQYESMLLEYESKMKSMEELWQKQIQMRLSVTSYRKGLASNEIMDQQAIHDEVTNLQGSVPRLSASRNTILSDKKLLKIILVHTNFYDILKLDWIGNMMQEGMQLTV